MSDPPGSFLARARGFAVALARRGARLRLGQAAASLSFLSLLALVPVFTIAVSLLGALPMLARLRETLLKFLAANLFLPSFSETVVRYLNQFAAKAGELSLLGALVFFATAFSSLLTIDRTLNGIWGAERPRPLARRLTVYWTFLTLGPLLMAASLAVNGLVASELFGDTAQRQVERLWLSVVPWLLTLGVLTLLYRLVPNAPVRWVDAFAGALAATVVLDLLKSGLGWQVARLPTYTVVYGTFAALPLFLVWLFMLWMTVLAGAVLAATMPYWGAGPGALLRPTTGRRFELAAQVLEYLARAAREGKPSVAAAQLQALFSGDRESAADTIRLLVSLGYASRFWRLAESGPVDAERAIWDEHWMLSPAAASMTLRPLFERLWDAPAEPGAEGRRFDAARLDRPLAG